MSDRGESQDLDGNQTSSTSSQLIASEPPAIVSAGMEIRSSLYVSLLCCEGKRATGSPRAERAAKIAAQRKELPVHELDVTIPMALP